MSNTQTAASATTDDTAQQPVYCRCATCNTTWIMARIPMPLREFADALTRATCPTCGNNKDVRLMETHRQ